MTGRPPTQQERGEACAASFWHDLDPAALPFPLDLLQPADALALLPPPLPPPPHPLDELGGSSGSNLQPEAAAPAARGRGRGGSKKASEEEQRARNRATQARFRERRKVGAAAGWLVARPALPGMQAPLHGGCSSLAQPAVPVPCGVRLCCRPSRSPSPPPAGQQLYG